MKRLQDFPSGTPDFLTTAQLADYLGFKDYRSALKWIARNHVIRHWRSQRCSLVRRVDVEKALGAR